MAVNQREVDGVPRLPGRLDDFQVGDTVRLTVRRAGQTRGVQVRLQAGAQ